MRNNVVLPVVLAASIATLILHLYFLNSTINSDEVFYVAAAETILNHASCGPLSALASLQPCNLEHPPLGKLLMAASIYALGDGSLGVRLPSIVSGTLCVPAISWLAWALSRKNERATIATAALISTSPVLFLLSSVGMLDSIELLFGLLGLAVYFSRGEPGRARSALAGVLIGLSILSKEVAVLWLLGLAAYLLRFGRLRDGLWVVASSTATFFIGLWAYDVLYTPFANPLQHATFILETGLRLTNQAGFAVSPVGWFFQNQELLLALLSLAWVPIALSQAIRMGDGEGGILPLGLFVLVAALTPQVALYYALHRQEYLFYDLQILPSLVLGASGLAGLPRVPLFALVLLLSASALVFVYSFTLPQSVFAILSLVP